MKIGVLAVQGSFALHVKSLLACSVEPVLVKRSKHLEGLEGIILPGGESTTFHIVMSEDDLLVQLRNSIKNGLPTWGTCAGAIMLGHGEGIPERWNLINIEVVRNAFGRQVDSFVAPLKINGLESPFDGVFIRAPRFKLVSPTVEVLSSLEGEPVMASERKILVSSFHPELTNDLRVHQFFLTKFCDWHLRL